MTYSVWLQDAHAREVAALYRQLANFWQEASKALSVIKFPNLDMAAGDKTKHLTKKSAEVQLLLCVWNSEAFPSRSAALCTPHNGIKFLLD